MQNPKQIKQQFISISCCLIDSVTIDKSCIPAGKITDELALYIYNYIKEADIIRDGLSSVKTMMSELGENPFTMYNRRRWMNFLSLPFFFLLLLLLLTKKVLN